MTSASQELKKSSDSPFVLLVGCGHMGRAIFDGWMAADLPFSFAILSPRVPENLPAHIKTFSSPQDLKAFGKIPDMIVLAVKPALAPKVIPALAEALTADKLQKSCLLSVMAGVTVEQLKRLSGNAPSIVAMPNIAAQLRSSATAVFIPSDISSQGKKLALNLVEAFGSAIPVSKEEDLRPATGLAGSGSAYVFLLAELLTKAGTENGLKEKEAAALARDMIYGAGLLLKNSSESAKTLRERVTSPNGTTAAALKVLMEPENWPASIEKAVKAAITRSQELSDAGQVK